MAQGHERPGSRAVSFSVGSTAGFSKNAVALGDSIGSRWSTAMTRDKSGESMLIEAQNQMGNGIAGATTSSLGGSAIVLSGSNSKKSFGAGNVACGFRL